MWDALCGTWVIASSVECPLGEWLSDGPLPVNVSCTLFRINRSFSLLCVKTLRVTMTSIDDCSGLGSGSQEDDFEDDGANEIENNNPVIMDAMAQLIPTERDTGAIQGRVY